MRFEKLKKIIKGEISKTIRILIIDEDSQYVKVLKKEIESSISGCSIFSVSDLENISNSSENFQSDLIITNDMNSKIAGLKIFENLRKIYPDIPIIILTSEESNSKSFKFLQKGAADCIEKKHIKKIIWAVNKSLNEIKLGAELHQSKLKLAEYGDKILKYNKWEKNIPGMIYQFVLHPDGKYSFLYVSSSSVQMFGMKPEEMVGDIERATGLMHPDDIRETQKAISLSALTLKSFKKEARFIINGEIKWYRFISNPELQENGDVIWDGFIIDNTENKHLEEELTEERKQINKLITALQNYKKLTGEFNFDIENKSDFKSSFLADAFFDQNQFNILMDNLPDAIYFKDLDSKYIRVNKHQVLKVGEFSETSVLGKSDSDFFDKEHSEESRSDELEIIKTGIPLINKVQKETWPSGKVTWVSTTKMPLRDSENNIVGTFGMSRDISKLKRMEKDLADERNLLREIIDAIPERIYVRDKNGNFILNNIADTNAIGIKKTAAENKIDESNENVSPKNYEEDLKIIESGYPIINKEAEVKLPNGNRRWYLTNKVALRGINKEITGMVGISHDLTLRKKIESALLQSEKQLTNALKIAKLAYWEYDILNDYFILNDQFYSLFRTTAAKEGGYKMSSSKYTSRFVYPEDISIVKVEIHKAVETNDPEYSSQLEHRIIYADGEIGYFAARYFIIKNSAGQTIKGYGALQDITQRKRIEEALRASEYFLRKSQFIAQIGSYSLDLKSGKWEGSNTIDEIFGIDENFKKDIEGWLNVIHPDDRSTIEEYYNEEILTKKKRFEKEYRIIRIKDKQLRWVLGYGDLEFDSDGTALRLIGTIQDITERVIREQEKLGLEIQLKERNKKLEEAFSELKQMQNSLVNSEKLASLGQLTTGIAHEINNPLAFVSSNMNRLNEYFLDAVELIKKWGNLGVKLQQENYFESEINSIKSYSEEIDLDFILEDFGSMMKSISDGIRRIKKIVEGLRGFAHMADSTYTNASINQAIDETLTIVWNELKYKAEIKKVFSELPTVNCNIGEIKQVFVNLLVNAAHSINEKGVISITTSKENDFVKIVIQDTGSGISKENLKRIFDPFFTTKPVGKGTGLGLWVSTSIIEKHRGILTVESEVGIGSIFTIKLPINQKIKKTETKELYHESR